MNPQKSEKLNIDSLDYQHNIPLSFQAKLIQSAMGLLGMKKSIESKMIRNGLAKEPAKIPKSLTRNFNVRESVQNCRKIWTIAPNNRLSDDAILYFHGGAYLGNISKEHWNFIEQLLYKINAVIIIPDYPLAPEITYNELYKFVEELYSNVLINYPSKRIIFMGDSAGGGLALGFVQQLRNENKKQPVKLILFSPWLDLTMSNPDLEILDKEDKLLSVKGLKSAAQKYAGTSDLNDFQLSPIHGDFTGLCRVSIFTGTNDLLHADARKFRQIMKGQHINFNYYEYPKMFHDWVIITSLNESRDVINKVGSLIKN